MTLRCETGAGSEELACALVESIREVCKLRGESARGPGSLPNDGKVIEDLRPIPDDAAG
jgi:phenylacetate-CoA ligase